MGAVFVYLDAGLRLRFGIGIATDVRASLDDKHTLSELAGHTFGDGEAEESGSDDEEVKTSGHRLLRVSDPTAVTPFGEADELGFEHVKTGLQ
ncbi:hypothetical protein MSTO_40800 [Mycobacterium stomatepiae]|uniref:Uncharacterized protein n=1 Tax=Mycobacterium stomatepiae TaxID=470076 RepID=A0A7I7QC35_9MYCO|nr:hypothetical protein MSTO_40800 [Mycobacterium stomatepiae]